MLLSNLFAIRLQEKPKRMEQIFLESCSSGCYTSCLKILRKSVDVNCSDVYGQSGLMKVKYLGYFSKIKLALF